MKLPEVPVRVWTVWFEDLGGRTDSVAHDCMKRSERFASQTLMRVRQMLAWDLELIRARLLVGLQSLALVEMAVDVDC